MSTIKILLLADTHLGYDLPSFQRVKKRRLGNDFQRAYLEILNYAETENVDFIVHGGDMFYRALIKDWLIQQAYLPLAEITSKLNIPALLVPGNHERSRLPINLFSEQKNIHTFRIPSTFNFTKNGLKISFSGFPCIRQGIKNSFKQTVAETGFHKSEADLKFLCMHQSVEGATVGIQNYVFRPWGKGGDDVIQIQDIPSKCSAILTGHIHREQILTHDLNGTESPAPIIYPGSIQRTAYAERDETKGCYILEFSIKDGRTVMEAKFISLYSSPMYQFEIDTEYKSKNDLHEEVIGNLKNIPKDSIVRIKFMHSDPAKIVYPSLKKIEAAAPKEMKINMSTPSIFFKKKKNNIT